MKPATATALPGRDRATIALIGLAHGTSHFFQLVLPPLFPALVVDLHTSYTELGVVMTVFFITSGLGQPLAGFLVDRFRARTVLLLGLGMYVLAVALMAAAPSVAWLYPAMVLAGLGNCVFHPADYTVLTASIRASHLGRAYGVHTLGGNLGWALAPAFMLGIAEFASWRTALLAAAGLGAAVLLLVWSGRHLMRDERDAIGPQAPAAEPAVPQAAASSVLLSPAVVLCFGYFVLLAAALIAVQNFLPPILDVLHGTALATGAVALTAFLLGASCGVLAGGIVADRELPPRGIIAAGLAGAALVFVVVAQLALPATVLVAALFVAGFLSGITTPSRDMLVRSATPRGATGRVFGVVYSGLDVGSALAPITVGALLDHGHAQVALWAVALFFAAAILTAVAVRSRPQREPVTA